ncbi:hypothetical protein SELMODRAFT_427457 [Selaginella moellendorffii]|uniref:Uncharacterized protein n=1 Tax=Selaginella moellendorffii TaxID=88036 RepID=D8SZP1_SELML|nr:hypothetical protein SELMODRAFT_427457 [Selaginella moellendorffii]
MAMTNLVNLAFMHQNHLHKDLFLIQKKNGELEAEWKPLHHSSVKATRMDPTKVIELNHFIIWNTYVRLGQYDLLCLFEHTFRYMDDLVSMNNPMILHFLDPDQVESKGNLFWIYPLRFLAMQNEMDNPFIGTDGSLVNLSAHFLSLQIQIIWVDGTFLTTKYDKRQSLPFKVSLYIHRDSNHPVANSSKVILGQVFALFYLINIAGGVILEIDNLVECFVEKGFHRYALRRLILSGLDRIILTSPLTPVQAVMEILFDIWRELANRPPQLDDSANSS